MEQPMYNVYNGNTNDDLCEWLQPYSKEEMQKMMIELAHADHAIYQEIMNRISTDIKWCKLFVHGLHPNTTKHTLERAFQQYGNLKEAVVMLEQHGRSKGWGFVIYETAAYAHNALSGAVVVDGRRVQCDYAFKKPKRMDLLNQPVISPEQRLAADGRRLFIHDLAWKTTHETLRRAFLQYGEIQEAVVIHDRQTNKSKGFGFVTFTTKAAAEMALREPVKRIDDRNAKVAYAKATKDASSVTPPYRQSPSPDSVSSGRYSQNGSNHGSNHGNNCDDGAPRPMLKRPSLDLINVSTNSNGSNQSIGSVNSYSQTHSVSSVPSYSVISAFHTPNQSVSNQFTQNVHVGFPSTQLQVGISSMSGSESAPITPAETPVLLPMIASATPPMVPLPVPGNQQPQQEYGAYLMPVSMLPNMGVNVMHPSMLLAPPPSPNSLGIRSNPEHSPLIMQQPQPVPMQQK